MPKVDEAELNLDVDRHINLFTTQRLSMADCSAASMQAMLLDDDCHPIDSVEVVLFVWNELTRQPREGW
jgi:hypothetical protein